MIRCFIALRLDAKARQALFELGQQLLSRKPEHGARKIRPVPRANLHLTVKFLGNTADAQIKPLSKTLAELSRDFAPYPQTLRATVVGLDAFPNRRRPRAIFAAIHEGLSELRRLMDEVEVVCQMHGFDPERKPRVPHVTVARIERARPNGPVSDFIGQHADQRWGTIDTSALVLYQSQLQPSGSVYTPLATFPLNKPKAP